MEDRRRSKRSDLDIRLEVMRVDGDRKETMEQIQVTNMSRSGLGFLSDQDLEMDSFYDARIRIWTGETIETVIKIVRRQEKNGIYQYGSTFVGMPEADKMRVDIYQIVNEEE